jgi:hypothetical protein
MNISLLIVTVGIATEFIKKALLKIKIEIKGVSAVILAILVSAVVVILEVFKVGGQFTFQTIWVFIQVVIGSTVGYSILTKSK